MIRYLLEVFIAFIAFIILIKHTENIIISRLLVRIGIERQHCYAIERDLHFEQRSHLLRTVLESYHHSHLLLCVETAQHLDFAHLVRK